MKILILGSSTINKGAEAMLRTVQAELAARIPGAQFFVGDRRARQWRPEQVTGRGVHLAEVAIGDPVRRRLRLARHMALSPEGPAYWYRDRGRYDYLVALADSVDAAVDVSGFLFSDKRGRDVARKHASIVEIVRQRGKPFVFMPQAWGPFEDTEVREFARRAAQNASLVFARDDISQQYLQDILNGADSHVHCAPDMAFLFKPADNGAELIANLGLDPERPTVAIAPNMRVYERTVGDGTKSTYAQMLTQVAEDLRANGAQILLLPHETLPGADQQDDRYMCELIARDLAGEDVAAVTDIRTAEDLKAMVAHCDLLIGSRFHALIAALSSEVPAIAIGWAHKYPELFREFDLEHLVLDHDRLTEPSLRGMVQDVWSDRAALREQIKDRLPSVKARASHVFDRVAEHLATD